MKSEKKQCMTISVIYEMTKTHIYNAFFKIFFKLTVTGPIGVLGMIVAYPADQEHAKGTDHVVIRYLRTVGRSVPEVLAKLQTATLRSVQVCSPSVHFDSIRIIFNLSLS